MPKYRVLRGLNYPDGKGGEKRAEEGDVVEDLPEKDARWLERDGHVARVGARPGKQEEGGGD